MTDYAGEEFSWINNAAPGFKISGDNVTVLSTPSEFYDSIIDGIKNAKHRIVLSSLYIGTSDLEKEMVNVLRKKLKDQEHENCKMDVDILFDYLRGSRGDPNSKTMLLSLLEEFSEPKPNSNVDLSVSLYHTPQLRGIQRSIFPERFNEIVGVAHVKVFLFDDSFIMSGANLSENYFQNRQDRFMLFKDCPKLADFFQNLVKTVKKFSFDLKADGSVEFSPQCPHHPFEGNYDLFATYAHSHLAQLISPYYQATTHKSRSYYSYIFDYVQRLLGYNLNENTAIKDKPNQDTSPSNESPQQFGNCDTVVYPSLQLGCVGLRHDEQLTARIFDSFPTKSNVTFTSGYFNATDSYLDSIMKSPAKFSIITAAPEANGFLGSKGFSGYIPAAYTQLTKQFFNRSITEGRRSEISLHEYYRQGWTYHAKGLWYFKENESLPCLTMIGSPNFGYRSCNRDLEAQVTIITKNKNLMKQLYQEQLNILKRSREINEETFLQKRYFIPRWVSLVTNIVKNYF